MAPRLAIALALCLLCTFAWLGCDVEEPCGTSHRFVEGVCVPAARPIDAAMPDAAEPADDEDAGGGACELDDRLGVDCAIDAECGCGADYCAIMPGQTIGYCTVTPCTPGGDDCPDGWSCFDLSAVGVAGVAPFCTRP